MSSLVNLIKIVGILVPGSALIVCTGNLDGTANDPPSGRPLSPLGTAKESLTEGGWKVVASGDINFDGMADVLWNNPGKNTAAVWLKRSSSTRCPPAQAVTSRTPLTSLVAWSASTA